MFILDPWGVLLFWIPGAHLDISPQPSSSGLRSPFNWTPPIPSSYSKWAPFYSCFPSLTFKIKQNGHIGRQVPQCDFSAQVWPAGMTGRFPRRNVKDQVMCWMWPEPLWDTSLPPVLLYKVLYPYPLSYALAKSCFFFFSPPMNLLPEKLCSPLGGSWAKRHNQAKDQKDLLLAARKENTGDLSQSSVFPTAKLGKFYAKGTCLLMKGLGLWTESKIKWIEVMRVRKGQHIIS